jgi:hypothetical protein
MRAVAARRLFGYVSFNISAALRLKLQAVERRLLKEL